MPPVVLVVYLEPFRASALLARRPRLPQQLRASRAVLLNAAFLSVVDPRLAPLVPRLLVSTYVLRLLPSPLGLVARLTEPVSVVPLVCLATTNALDMLT